MHNFKVMLAKPLDERKLSFPCYVSPKLDGIRAQYYNGEFYTRNKKVVAGMSHLKQILKPFGEMKIWLDGELLVPGLTFQESSGIIRSYREAPEVVYHVFDLPYMLDTLDNRLSAMNLIVRDINSPMVKAVDHMAVSSAAEIHKYYKYCRDAGYEGTMVKALFGVYENKRSAAWMKMKEVETYDVLCTGFFEGQGRLTGTLGGIIVDLDGVSVRVGGGFSDSDREHIWSCRDQYRGAVCEIAGQERTPDGSLRHPRFITWRPDK